MNFDELSYLLISYLIVADGEINDKELRINDKIFTPSETLKIEQAKIFADSDDKTTIKDLINELKQSNCDLKPLFNNLYQIIYADGYYDTREKAFVLDIANQLDYSKDELAIIENDTLANHSNGCNRKEILWHESLRSIFNALIYELKEDKNSDDKYELLSGLHFVKKIESITSGAHDDLLIIDKYMNQYNTTLSNYYDQYKSRLEHIKNKKKEDENTAILFEYLDHLNIILKDNIISSLESNLEIINKKRRTINYFTIAFMGRTKSGKSTLHKVITHEDADDIGSGKLRTTRYNRSWYWENIRIVDTPGIGAPGGKNDTETARTIVDEADIICYIVTNDSIQETEFDFLINLKEKNKPLFIILNVKENLDHPTRKERFLNNPLHWKNNKEEKNIQGHLDRIKECVGDNYNFDAIEIIPLQLLAAKKYYSDLSLSENDRQAFFEGSNIKEFIYKIKQSVYKTGGLKKSQNIIDGCTYQIKTIREELQSSYDSIYHQSYSLMKKRDEIKQFINKEKEKSKILIQETIKNSYQKQRNNVKPFTERHFEKKDIQTLWNNDVENIRINGSLKLSINNITSDLLNSINARVNECLDDFYFETEQRKIINQINGKKNTNSKFYAKLALGGIATGLSLAAKVIGIKAVAALAITANPVVLGTLIIIGVGAALTYAVNKLFKSKEEKDNILKKKIAESLISNIDKIEKEQLSTIINSFSENISNISGIINDSFSSITNESIQIINDLNRIIERSKDTEKAFNKAFAIRILEFLNKQKRTNLAEYDLDNIMTDISVCRKWEKGSMDIRCPHSFSEEEIELANILTQMTIKFIK